MNFKEEASRLIEKIYNLKGSNQANEAQALLEAKLKEAFIDGNRYTTASMLTECKNIIDDILHKCQPPIS